MSNYYEQSSVTTVEYAILAEDLKFSSIQNLLGKFYVPILTPEADTSSTSTTKTSTTTTTNYVELAIPAYMLIQFMEPVTTGLKKTVIIGDNGVKYDSIKFASSNVNAMVVQKTTYTIKKGTRFLIAFLGGYMKLDKIKIIGIDIAITE